MVMITTLVTPPLLKWRLQRVVTPPESCAIEENPPGTPRDDQR
jgi:hypothetical protein